MGNMWERSTNTEERKDRRAHFASDVTCAAFTENHAGLFQGSTFLWAALVQNAHALLILNLSPYYFYTRREAQIRWLYGRYGFWNGIFFLCKLPLFKGGVLTFLDLWPHRDRGEASASSSSLTVTSSRPISTSISQSSYLYMHKPVLRAHLDKSEFLCCSLACLFVLPTSGRCLCVSRCCSRWPCCLTMPRAST